MDETANGYGGSSSFGWLGDIADAFGQGLKAYGEYQAVTNPVQPANVSATGTPVTSDPDQEISKSFFTPMNITLAGVGVLGVGALIWIAARS